MRSVYPVSQLSALLSSTLLGAQPRRAISQARYGCGRSEVHDRTAPPASPTTAHNETPRVPVNPVNHLAPNPYNPRATLAAIEEMADSLTGKGIIQPLTVVTRDAFLAAHPEHASDLTKAHYVVVDGNRRLAGTQLAGLDDVPVHVDDSLAGDADTLLETALTAAVQHEDLEPLDEARALQRLVRSARLSAGSRPVARQVQRMGHPETCPPQPDPRAQAGRLREDDSPGCRPHSRTAS
ncbi:ParB/RepB/Spo0J family partition protein [Streptomyces sp. NPDC001480]|uniref:ParB/RepB/Spo0J family partition protein n=1 Tax=Streptomyces sp. NPDC001480 TaxID=3364577 RepID=UPI00367E11E2